jgi:lipid A 4'-phosphatase
MLFWIKRNILKINTFFFVIFSLFFLCFPEYDIIFSNFFFSDGQFLSERLTLIKDLRSFFKDFMVLFSLSAFFLLVVSFLLKKIKGTTFTLRHRLVLLGLVIGPIVGCGIIANMYFKDTWGRARPAYVNEFGGDKIYTAAFQKSDQCEKNCSWISGEASAAFSFISGTILLKNPIFLVINIFIGFIVSFFRISMGGHFLSDNIFAMFFMIYLAVIYRYLAFKYLKKYV